MPSWTRFRVRPVNPRRLADDIVKLDDLLSELRVQEITTEEVITTAPDAFIEEVARLMTNNKIDGLPVVDEDNHVVESLGYHVTEAHEL